MTRYWKIRAGSGGEHWGFWKQERIISVGWDVGDLKTLSWDNTRDEIERKWEEGNPGGAAGIVRRFAGVEEDGMREGDLVIILGSASVLDLAKVGDFEYHKGGIPEGESHAYWRRVDFLDLGPKLIRDLPEKFQMYNEFSLHLPGTLSSYDVKEELIEELMTALKEAAPIDLEEGLLSFDEDSVQQYVERNFKDVDPTLVSVKREYKTRVGDADFLAVEKGCKVIIEVKTGTAQDNAVGQLLGYMNAIRGETNEKVRGILLAEGFTERVKEAVKSDAITLVAYKARLDFTVLR